MRERPFLSTTGTACAVQGAPGHTLLHASGVVRDALLSKQTAAGIRAVFAAKVSSSRTGHESLPVVLD